MFTGQYIFTQIMDLVNWKQFPTYVERYHGDCRVRQSRYSDYFRMMVFVHLTYCESLHDIFNCLRSIPIETIYQMRLKNVIDGYLAHFAKF
jgi:hypothetical protein